MHGVLLNGPCALREEILCVRDSCREIPFPQLMRFALSSRGLDCGCKSLSRRRLPQIQWIDPPSSTCVYLMPPAPDIRQGLADASNPGRSPFMRWVVVR